MDLARFREMLLKKPIRERFRIDRYPEDVPAMLKECYQYEVYNRGLAFKDDPATNEHIEKAAKWLVGRYKTGLMLFGTVGNGKTTLSAAISRLISMLYESPYLHERKGVRTVSALELAALAKDNPDKFAGLKQAELLVIDDVGVEPAVVKVWGNEISPFTEIMYYRYDRQLWTLVTTNLDDEDFYKRYGPRLADRFTEMFDKIPFENNTYRR